MSIVECTFNIFCCPIGDNVTTDSYIDSYIDDRPSSASGLGVATTNKPSSRKTRESGEENTVDHDITKPKSAAKVRAVDSKFHFFDSGN